MLNTVCLPILTYGTVATSLSQSEINSLTFAYNNIFHKLFQSSNKNVIEQCQLFSGFLRFRIRYDLMRFSFLSSQSHLNNYDSDPLYRADYSDLTLISKRYNLSLTDSPIQLKNTLWSYFEQNLDLST